jgi:hypothetical protein
MRKKGLPAVAVIIVAAGLAMAGATARPAPTADLSTALEPLTALESLIATGVLPADVTGEPGVWNFAGPASACPGPGWNCVTPGVFAVQQNGTVNVLVASPAQCTGSQQAGVYNQMHCVEEEKELANAHQTCGTEAAPIDQDAQYNELICELNYDVTSTEPTQCVLQEGHFVQSGPAAPNDDPAETNKFKGQFRIVQQMSVKSADGKQTQDARQRIDGKQTAKQWNQSEIQEVETQKLTGSATTQEQNAGCPLPPEEFPDAGDCNPAVDPDPSDPDVGPGPTTPYTCVDLTQIVRGGKENISKLKQELQQDAQTTAMVATETQGQPTGGQDGAIHQEIIAGGSRNLGVANQYTYQTLPDEDRLLPGQVLTQTQIEDGTCCFGTLVGETEGEEAVVQVIQQKAGPRASQLAEATGISSSAGGGCIVTHNIENNGGDAQTSRAADPPCAITSVSGCSASGGEGGCFSNNCPPGEFFNNQSGRCEEVPTETSLTAPRLGLAGSQQT